MNLKTERLLLRNYKTEDWERVRVYGSNPDFSKYELWGPNTLEDTHKFVAEMVHQTETNPRYKFNFAVCLKESELLIDYGFQKLSLSVIYATCDTRNAPSYRVMEKLGMKKVGFIKGTKEVKGHVRDSYRYEILPSQAKGN